MKQASMTRLDRYLTFFMLRIASAVYKIRKSLSRQKNPSIPLYGNQTFFEHHGAVFFQHVIPNLVHQFNPAACSVASVATVLNSAQDLVYGKAGAPISQTEILDKVAAVHWKERISPKGHEGRRGLPLAMLGAAVESSFAAYHIPCDRIDVVDFSAGQPEIEARRAELKQRLADFNESLETFIISHFNQGLFTRDLHLPHISPVGAYDPENQLVLILDVDTDQLEPYWVHLDTFFEGMTWDYHGVLKKYGYSGGGYVWIELLPGSRPKP